MDLGLKNRVAIVAASSSGIGKAIALGLAREGAQVAICSRDRAKIDSAAREIQQATEVEPFAAAVDVADEQQVADFVRSVSERWGRLDICVTNAGGPPARTFAEATIPEWRSSVDLNLMSVVYLAREALPIMQEQRWGRLITITSVSVKQPLERLILSNSVRSAVAGLVRSLSNEYAPYNILVNNVCPGYTATARLRDLMEQNPEMAAKSLAQIPLGRFATPGEVADLVVFLASERASYLSGASVAVDGGFIKASSRLFCPAHLSISSNFSGRRPMLLCI